MEQKPKKWEIELKLPKGLTKTFVYSTDGKNILDRFKPCLLYTSDAADE